jgi:hypothetical protein
MTMVAAKASVITSDTPTPSTPPLTGSPDHQRDSEQRDTHRNERAACDRLAQRDPREQSGKYGSGRLHEEDVRNGRVIERNDERA